MNETTQPTPINRRDFLKRGSAAAFGAGVLAQASSTGVFAADDQVIRLALIGCGGRGTGAVGNALSVRDRGPVQLYAMADVWDNKLATAHSTLKEKYPEQVDVPADRRFVGFDAYRKAIDVLRPGDVALCTTRAYVRPVHVEYAIQKGINVFMEKPFAADPVGLRRLLRAGEEADRRNVKVAAGLQCRHSPARQELIKRIRNGELGDILVIRADRLGGWRMLEPQGDNANDLMSQLQFGKIHLFWVGSGHMVDNLIHQIDECCWIKDAWPVAANGLGGRVCGSEDRGQNVDVYSIEYSYPDGTKAICGFRRMNQARTEFATYLHGTHGAAQFSGRVHAATVHQFKDQRIARDNILWTPPKDAFSPWDYEWQVMLERIRKDQPHNELRRAVYSDFASLMGRAACHLGQTVTWEQILESDFQWCDYLDDLDYDSPVPVRADAGGQFPIPVPGEWREV